MGLKLSRREQESIRIGIDVVVEIVKISGSSVILEVTAPGDVTIRLDKTLSHHKMESDNQDRLSSPCSRPGELATTANPDHVSANHK